MEELVIKRHENKVLRDSENQYIKGTHIDIYGDDYSTEIHAGKFFIHLYNELCNTFIVNKEIDLKGFLDDVCKTYELDDSDFLIKFEQSSNKKIGKVDYNSSQYFIKIKDKLLAEIHSHRVVFWYGSSINFSLVAEVAEMVKKYVKKREHSRKFYMIASSPHSEFGFDLQEFDVKKIKVNIEENYNDDFQKTDKVITGFLKDKGRNGLVLLHGKFGTGKTTYIRSIISNINRRFIFLPLNLMEAISAPNFLPFISQYKDSVLILEDCEDLLKSRETNINSNNSLVNLLNLGDGLLSDALSIKIICTFNIGLQQIDQAILRKGRLVARYEFKALEIEKAQALSDKNKLGLKIEKPMTLAELYHKNSEDYSIEQERKKVGF